MIKIIIVDDTRLFREGIKQMVQSDEGIQVVATATNGLEALELCDKYLPDAVLMDIVMPISDGVEGTKLIKQKYPSIKVVMLTTSTDNENITQAVMNGADGYVLKDVTPEELVLGIKSVVAGLNIIDKNVYKQFTNKFSNYVENENLHKQDNSEFNLTEREIDVIKLISTGKNNREIANELFIAEGRVKNIITGILSKMSMKDRTQLAVYAVKHNWV